MTFPKRYLASKSANKWLRFHQKKIGKRVFLAKIELEKTLEKHDLFEVSHVFQPSFDDISAICWSILMQDTILERSLDVDYMAEIWI